jgi:dTDP-4-dehydrorhamnose reductase
LTLVAIIGGTGQLAHDLKRRWHERHPDDALQPLGHQDVEISDLDSVRRTLHAIGPALVINCAAYHRTDVVEENPAPAFAVNAIGPRNLALVCRELGAVLVHLSTDYVFSGSKRQPYVEWDAVDPIQVYGVSKVAGEQLVRLWSRHFIVRSSGLYGEAGSSGKGGNFVETMRRLAATDKPIKVVDDQIFTPTSTWSLADQISLLATTNAYGTYHATCQGSCSWYEFAREIFGQTEMHPNLQPQTTMESGARAARPPYSVLENANLKRRNLDVMPAWADALAEYLHSTKPSAVAATA